MLMLILNVFYVLLAIGMTVLVLLQRGAGAQAGSGFGGGASSTVFGARGASNFLSKSTKWLAVLFFAISLFMAWHATNTATQNTQQDLGVMAQLPETAPAPAAGDATVPAAPAAQPPAAAPTSTVPAAPAPAAQPQPTAPPAGG